MQTKNKTNLLAHGQQLRHLFDAGTYLKTCSIEKNLQELVKIRVSQINGCAHCLDMHWKDARAAGETEQRLYGLGVWHESPYYSERERVALEWAEAVTKCRMTDKLHIEVAEHFTEEELIDLTIVATVINTWNRLNICFPKTAGTYHVGQFG